MSDHNSPANRLRGLMPRKPAIQTHAALRDSPDVANANSILQVLKRARDTDADAAALAAMIVAAGDRVYGPLTELAAAFLEPKPAPALYRGPGTGARSSDPDTSKRAVPGPRKATTHAHRLLGAIHAAGGRGATADEACRAAGLPQGWRRVSELIRDGLVRQRTYADGITDPIPGTENNLMPDRQTSNGQDARVWVMTDAGRSELSRLDAAGPRRKP